MYLVVRLSANACLKQSTLIKQKGGYYVIFNTNDLGPEAETEVELNITWDWIKLETSDGKVSYIF